MGNDTGNRYSRTGKKNMPIARPNTYSDDIRYSEIEVSLYSEFSEDEDEDTNNTKLKIEEMSEK